MLRLIAIAMAALVLIPQEAKAEIDAVAIAGTRDLTRITVFSDTEISHETSLRLANGGPELGLTMPGETLRADAFLSLATGGVASYASEANGIRFELSTPMMVAREFTLPPTGDEPAYRLVLELSPVSQARFEQAATAFRQAAMVETAEPAPEPEPVSAELVSQPLPQPAAYDVASPQIGPSPKPVIEMSHDTARSFRIVIDAGHGGHDPGAIAPSNGTYEKTVVLKAALTLRDLLEADPRYEVSLTRDGDSYVDHEDRVAHARNWHADLFISIHADSAAVSSVAGATVYTLSAKGERRQDGVAREHDWALPIEDGTPDAIAGILTDFTKRETKSNSAIFAEYLTAELGKAGPLVRNSHRRENLFVLLAPDVPAVLLEIGFLSNASDASRIASSEGRSRSMQAVKRAIDAYVGRSDHKYIGH